MSFLKLPSLSGLKFLSVSPTQTIIARTNERTGIKFSVGLNSRGRKAMGRVNEVRCQAKTTVNKVLEGAKSGLSAFGNISYYGKNIAYHLRGQSLHKEIQQTKKLVAEGRLIKERRALESAAKAKASQQNQRGSRSEG